VSVASSRKWVWMRDDALGEVEVEYARVAGLSGASLEAPLILITGVAAPILQRTTHLGRGRFG